MVIVEIDGKNGFRGILCVSRSVIGNTFFAGKYLKFTQDPKLCERLMSIKDLELVEASPTDTIWGIGDPKNFNKAFSPHPVPNTVPPISLCNTRSTAYIERHAQGRSVL
jgi:hypothetical protein